MDGMDGWWKLPTEEMNDMCNERERVGSVNKKCPKIYVYNILPPSASFLLHTYSITSL